MPTNGKIIDKTPTEYVDDSLGNGIEQKTLLWDTKSEFSKQKLDVTILPTINYF
jgi:hypothetical protein